MRCPKCGAVPQNSRGTLRCDPCGYQSAALPPTQDYPLAIYDPVFTIAWEITRGWNSGRAQLHACIRRFFDSEGVVLDLGAGKNPSYLPLLNRKPIIYLRGDGLAENDPDLLINFDEQIPLADDAVDAVLLFNVLEHVYDHRFLLSEAIRVLKPGGTLYLYVPYIIRIHNCPSDYFRYTDRALQRLFADAGFTATEIYAGGGLFRFLPALYRKLGKVGIGYLLYPLTLLLCLVDSFGSLISRGRYQKDLPSGFFCITRKPEARSSRSGG